MNKSVIDFTKGVRSVNIETFRSTPLVNQNDMVKVTIVFKKKENITLYNALRYDNEGTDSQGV